jgi:hypothetical protein
MNSTKYRQIVLTENYQNNQFRMIKEKINVPRYPCYPWTLNFQRNHPKFLSEEAFWISHDEMCIGYHSATNPDIFRPVFSYKRQKLLDKLNSSVNNPDLGFARRKYLLGLDKYFVGVNTQKKLPMDCIEIMLSFIHNKL